MDKITDPEFFRIIGRFLNEALMPVLASAFFRMLKVGM